MVDIRDSKFYGEPLKRLIIDRLEYELNKLLLPPRVGKPKPVVIETDDSKTTIRYSHSDKSGNALFDVVKEYKQPMGKQYITFSWEE